MNKKHRFKLNKDVLIVGTCSDSCRILSGFSIFLFFWFMGIVGLVPLQMSLFSTRLERGSLKGAYIYLEF